MSMPRFTRRTGIEVNYTTFDSNGHCIPSSRAAVRSYDVIVPSDYMISKAGKREHARRSWISVIFPISVHRRAVETLITTLKTNSPCRTHGAPSACSIIPIMSPEPVTSWSILWDEQYSGKILMFDNPRDAFAIAQEPRFSLNSHHRRKREWSRRHMLLKEKPPLCRRTSWTDL